MTLPRDITVTVILVCPHCGEGFSIQDVDFIDAARDHIDAHTLEPEGEPDPDGG